MVLLNADHEAARRPAAVADIQLVCLLSRRDPERQELLRALAARDAPGRGGGDGVRRGRVVEGVGRGHDVRAWSRGIGDAVPAKVERLRLLARDPAPRHLRRKRWWRA